MRSMPLRGRFRRTEKCTGRGGFGPSSPLSGRAKIARRGARNPRQAGVGHRRGGQSSSPLPIHCCDGPLSMVCEPIGSRARKAAGVNSSATRLPTTTAMPGFVQNWPAPVVSEAARRRSRRCACQGRGRRDIGLTEPGSPKNGIGSVLCAHRSKSAPAPPGDPVKPTALMKECCTRAVPTSRLPPWIKLTTPGCMPCVSAEM